MNACGYNQDLFLWQNWRASNPDAHLTVVDGHIMDPDGGGCLARFDDDAHAAKVLTEAGCKFTVQPAQPPMTAAEHNAFPQGRWGGKGAA